jgi:hypothetical protein
MNTMLLRLKAGEPFTQPNLQHRSASLDTEAFLATAAVHNCVHDVVHPPTCRLFAPDAYLLEQLRHHRLEALHHQWVWWWWSLIARDHWLPAAG